MNNKILDSIINYLDNETNYKWSTTKTLIKKLNIHDKYSALELDNELAHYYQNSKNPKIRFSTLPSSVNLNVLWGSITRVGKRTVTDIRKKNTPLQIKEFNNSFEKNMFLSYSFKDSELALELSTELLKHGLNPWIAEIDILERAHINESVISAIKELPFFGTLITKNILDSTWSAKEIEFAFSGQKDIYGFIFSNTLEVLVQNINGIQAETNTARRDEIYRKLFDGNANVKFLLYPSEEKVEYLKSLGYENVLYWQEIG